MKDGSGHYWIMGGTIVDMLGPEPEGFAYGTNDPKWKNRLPDALLAKIVIDIKRESTSRGFRAVPLRSLALIIHPINRETALEKVKERVRATCRL